MLIDSCSGRLDLPSRKDRAIEKIGLEPAPGRLAPIRQRSLRPQRAIRPELSPNLGIYHIAAACIVPWILLTDCEHLETNT